MTTQLCTFQVDNRTYAVDVLSVREVNPELGLTPVPHTPPAVRGLVNVRGQVFLILDLREALHGVRSEVGASSRLVLFKERVGHAFGVLVSSVGDIIAVEPEQLLELGGEGDDGTDRCRADQLSLGVVKLEDKLVVNLDPVRLLELIKPPSSRSYYE